jgi:hypothetical protein
MDAPEEIRRFDPSMKPGAVPTFTSIRHDLTIQREENNRAYTETFKPDAKKKPFYMIYGTQIGLSAAGIILGAGILYYFNPPITQVKRTDEYTQERQDWRKVVFALSLVGIAIFVMPDVMMAMRIFGKQKQ